MLRVIGGRTAALHGPHALARTGGRVCWRSNTAPYASHVNAMAVRGSNLRVIARQQQQKSLLQSRSFHHDRVLTASMGLISGGVVVTSLLNHDEDDGELMGQIKNCYNGDVDGFYSRGTGTRLDQPWFEDKNKAAVAALIAANTLVFGMWRVSFRNNRLHQFMWRHFACSYTAVVHGKRFHTLLTSAFSHITFPHFGINMFMLWEFGPHILAPSNNDAGAWYNQAVANSRFAGMVRENYYNFRRGPELLSIDKFMALYFTSAAASSALSALVSKLLLYGLFDLTATQMLELYTGLNILGAGFQRNLRVDCVGHLGGQAAGFAYHQASSRG
ncbi:hypothetical protein BBJ28_00012596 [Nothophytophthora sp. Chile5]|nr:hypothetical protein BBJ28_00012596 [Nothophytophthora sp. Chile5]